MAAVATVGLPVAFVSAPHVAKTFWWPVQGKNVSAQQFWVVWASLACAAVGVYGWRFGARWLGGRGSVAASLLAGAGLSVAAATVWNGLYWGLLQHQALNREIFRGAMRTPYAPLYGQPSGDAPWRAADAPWRAAVPMVALALVAAAGIAWRADRRWGWREWAAVLVLQAGLIGSFAASEPAANPADGRPTGHSRLTSRMPGYGLFDADARAFGSSGELLRTYVGRMPTLGWFGQHYPPGNLLLARADDATGRPVSPAFTVACAVAATPFAWLLAGVCGAGTVGRNAAALLFATATGVLVFPTLSPTAAVVLPAAACCWLAVRAVSREREDPPAEAGRAGGFRRIWNSADRRTVSSAAALGATWAAFTLFSYSAAVFGVLLAVALAAGVYERVIDPRRAAVAVGVAGATAILLLVGLWAASGFDALTAFRLAVRFHHEQQMNGAFDSPARYLLRSSGDLVAYAVSALPLTGLAGAAAWSAARRGCRSLADVLAKAVAASVVLAAFSGSFFLETERIWLFFTPALAAVAGAEVGRRAGVEGRGVLPLVAVLSLVLAAASELIFMHYRP